MSATCSAARSGRAGSIRPASSLLRVISDREWPRRSCRSRASRSRSSLAASWATVARASRSSTVVRTSCRTPDIAKPPSSAGITREVTKSRPSSVHRPVTVIAATATRISRPGEARRQRRPGRHRRVHEQDQPGRVQRRREQEREGEHEGQRRVDRPRVERPAGVPEDQAQVDRDERGQPQPAEHVHPRRVRAAEDVAQRGAQEGEPDADPHQLHQGLAGLLRWLPDGREGLRTHAFSVSLR